MKLCRFKINGQEKYGTIDGKKVFEIQGEPFDKIEVLENSYNLDEVELLCPTKPQTIFAIGLNYDDHAIEMGMDVLDKPLVFFKAVSALVPADKPIIKPNQVKEMSFEAELAIVVKAKCKNVSLEDADKYILGYSIVNDVTARDAQRHDGQWARSKSFDTFCPYGPVIETEFSTDRAIIRSYLGDKMVQNGNISDMIFSPQEILSYLSHQFTLYPGDIIATGTPKNVGTMVPGDVVTVEIENVGKLVNPVKLGDEN